ncbi:Reticulon-like protein B9 [Morella rubra]|uniref:Reticulon-like protein n=1 Tax=Morella rubra TaxID=262757 RepID=A0A6A1VIJ9_9ROSI|nr:Reticulon-like protein B9 [Morella rubra]
MASHHSSDSENETEQSAKGFLRGRSVHEALGGEKVADLLLWRNRIVSAALLIGVTVIWFLFEVVQYNFITFLCHISITAMLVFFIWNTGSEIFKWNPPKIPEIILQESTFTDVASTFHARFNQFLSKLLDIASGRELPYFLLATFSLYVLSVVGTYFSFLNFLYFGKNFVSFSSLSTRLCRAWAELVIFGVSGMKAFSPWKPCHFCMNDIRTTSTTLLIKCSETSKESTECSIQSS